MSGPNPKTESTEIRKRADVRNPRGCRSPSLTEGKVGLRWELN
jgi:hypothetical protein